MYWPVIHLCPKINKIHLKDIHFLNCYYPWRNVWKPLIFLISNDSSDYYWVGCFFSTKKARDLVLPIKRNNTKTQDLALEWTFGSHLARQLNNLYALKCSHVSSLWIELKWKLIHLLVFKILRKNLSWIQDAVSFIIIVYIFQKETKATRKDSIHFFDWKAKLHVYHWNSLDVLCKPKEIVPAG